MAGEGGLLKRGQCPVCASISGKGSVLCVTESVCTLRQNTGDGMTLR